jgi:hypothetical protein
MLVGTGDETMLKDVSGGITFSGCCSIFDFY